MAQLIPVDSAQASALEQALSVTMFRSTSDFISFYNSGLINKKAEEVVDFASRVDSTFKNVKLQGAALVFISENEVYLSEIVEALKPWEILVKVKRAVGELLQEGKISEQEVLGFTDDSTGILGGFTEDGFERLSDEKFFKGADEEYLKSFHRKFSSEESPLTFKVSDILNLNDSFIEKIYSEVFSA